MRNRENKKLNMERIADFIRRNIFTKPIKIKTQTTIVDPITNQYKTVPVEEYIFINKSTVMRYYVEYDPVRDKIVLTVIFTLGHLRVGFDKDKVFKLEGEIIST